MESKNTLLKTLLIVCIIVTVAAIIAAVSILKKSELDFNEKKAVIVKENMDLKEKFSSYQQEISEKLAALDSLQKEKDLFVERLDLVKKETAKLVNSYIRQLEDMKRKGIVYKKRIASLEKNSTMVTAAEHIKAAISKEENQAVKKVLEDTLRKMELIRSGKNVSLEPIVVTPESNVQSENIPTGKGGSVLSVDKLNNLIVINLGRKDGINEGDICVLLLDGQPIAKSDIVSVRYNIAAAYISSFMLSHSMDSVNQGLSVQVTNK